MAPGDQSDEENGGPSFADLVGDDTRKLDERRTRIIPSTTKPRPAVRASRESEEKGKDGFRWPDPEDRHNAARTGVSDTQLLALRRGDPEPEERIDLHGTRRDAAGVLLTKRLESAVAQGLRCVIVIHGRGQRSPSGDAVLRDAIPDWLSKGKAAKRVQAFATAPERLGGAGATLVLLKRSN